MNYNPFLLSNKTILITGASSGIGRQCAIDCSKMGAKIIGIARNKERLNEVLLSLEGTGHKIYPFDLNSLDQIKDLISEINNQVGKFDGFIHAAGIEKTLPIKLITPQVYEDIYRINVLSAFEIMRFIDSKKYFNDNGSVVFISSISAIIGRAGISAYSSSKGALISASHSMALELSKKHIRVNCISPGTILTPMMQSFFKEFSEKEIQERAKEFPLGLGNPEDISNACIYLLSDASRWITGINLVVDGGYTAR